MTVDEKETSPRFVLLKISATTHLQSHASLPATTVLQKSSILPIGEKHSKKLKS